MQQPIKVFNYKKEIIFESMHLQIILITTAVKCSFVLELLEVMDDNKSLIRLAQFAGLMFLGLFIAILGVSYLRITLFFLIALVMDVFSHDIYKKIHEAVVTKSSFLYIPYTYYEWLVDLVEKNKNIIGIAFLLVAAILAYLIVSIIKIISTFGFIIMALYLYREGFHEKAFIQLGINSDAIKFVFLFVCVVVLYVVFRKIPMLVFACFFGLFGAFLVATTVEVFFKLDWGFYKAFLELKNNNDTVNEPVHWVAFILIAMCFALYQCFVVVTGRYKG